LSASKLERHDGSLGISSQGRSSQGRSSQGRSSQGREDQPGSFMPLYDFSAPRLFVEAPLGAGARIMLDAGQASYLRNVLRLSAGDEISVFNGRDGEWRAALTAPGRKSVELVARAVIRPQPSASDLHYLFAPLKHARLDYMVQKAVEMGAGRLIPVLTHRTQIARVNLDRIKANAIEAAEQCGILCLPEIDPPRAMAGILATWQEDRLLVFCDEEAPVRNPLAALRACSGSDRARPLAVLIGPEGGFDAEERDRLLSLPHVLRLSLGPRILRADTAAVAALALIQAELGDWSG
jgi:16S rRNA (uracil1498-N3)-methyltransferase